MFRLNQKISVYLSYVIILLLIPGITTALDTLLVEDFEDGLPGDWTVLDGGDDGDIWHISNENTGSLVTQYMRVDSREAGPGGIHLDESLESPSIDLLEYNRVYLQFSTRYNNHSSDRASIEVSTDGGNNYFSVMDISYDFSAYPHNLDISSYCSREPDVKIRFRYDDENLWAWYWGVDDVMITAEYIDLISPEITVIDYPPYTVLNTEIPITVETWDDVGISNIDLVYGYWDYDLEMIAYPDTLDFNAVIEDELYQVEIPDLYTSEIGTIAFYVYASDPTGNSRREPGNTDNYYFTHVRESINHFHEHHEIHNIWYGSAGSERICIGDDVVEFLNFNDNGVGNFSWYGQEYNGVYVSSNGYISFEELHLSDPDNFPISFPYMDMPSSIIALFLYDLHGDAYDGEIEYLFTADRYLIITWDGVHIADDENASMTAQIVLDFLTGYINLNYSFFEGDMQDYAFSAGYQDQQGRLGDNILEEMYMDFEAPCSYIIHPPAGRIEGYIENQVTGTSLGTCIVRISEAGSATPLFTTVSNYYGNYHYYLPLGEYDVNYSIDLHELFERTINTVIIGLHDTTSVNTGLPEHIAIFENTVEDSITGQRLEDVHFDIFADYPNDLVLELLSDSNGEAFSNMYTGEFTIRCWKDGYHEKILTDIHFVDNVLTAFDWQLSPIDNVEENPEMPLSYNLFQNYPNPFNPETTISFSLKKRQFVTLKIYDTLGREVHSLVSSHLDAGIYNYQFNATSLASGAYFYKIETEEFSATRKMMLTK